MSISKQPKEIPHDTKSLAANHYLVYTETVKKIVSLVSWVALCEFVGLAGTPFTLAAIPTWYATLVKPPFAPPNWLFGPVWTMLYFLMGTAMFLVRQSAGRKKAVQTATLLFLAQLAANFLWSLLFFGLRSPILALADIAVLDILIVLTLLQFKRLSRPAAWLLVPYLLWVSFATVLNLSIVLLNP